MPEPTRQKKQQKPPSQSDTTEGNQRPAAMRRSLFWMLPAGAVAAALTMGAIYGVGTALLTLAGGVLLIVIAIFWASVRTLSGDAAITLEEAIALGAPTAAEEQKRAILQALKDLEFERSVGKIAEADYEELVTRYRTEAKRLLRVVDENLAPLREQATAFVAEQLGTERPAKRSKPPKKAEDPVCPGCQTDNDTDAAFCKKCGHKLGDKSKDARDATG
jgi:DNA-binding transcriptional ArsR family regulator/ribosomal protein L40E